MKGKKEKNMSENNSNENAGKWINHIEWLVLFITLLGGFYAVDGRIDTLNSRIDNAISSTNSRQDAINTRFDQFLNAWKEEAKDFHGRLCTIEERNKKI